MDNISFEDLISKQYLAKIKVVLPAFGTVTIKQLSASEGEAIATASIPLEGEALVLHIATHALSFVKGETPTEEEVQLFMENHTASTISKIYHAGIESSDEGINLDKAEKK